MTDRENWFKIVMGQQEVAQLIPTDNERFAMPIPSEFQRALIFELAV
jgi:hypothetical protein